MERDNRDYNDNIRNQQNRSGNRFRDHNEESFENYRDRYSDRGNYYGMRNEDAAYRNVESSGFGSDRSSERNRGRSNQEYHYGDPNPYMDNERNGGYERTRGTGWRDNNDRYNHYDSNRVSDRDHRGNDRYSRQDNSYEYGDHGSGKRYRDFGRDEGRTYNPDRNRGYNMATEDSYYDRSDFDRSPEDNNYRGSRGDREYDNWRDSSRDRDDYRYSGRVQRTGSGQSYGSDRPSNSDGDRTSSRQKRSGFSGPDYSSHSSISSYGSGEYRG
ncbi:hypothetical protein ACXYMU_12605 [Pontibacter sp. CAU 1760]